MHCEGRHQKLNINSSAIEDDRCSIEDDPYKEKSRRTIAAITRHFRAWLSNRSSLKSHASLTMARKRHRRCTDAAPRLWHHGSGSADRSGRCSLVCEIWTILDVISSVSSAWWCNITTIAWRWYDITTIVHGLAFASLVWCPQSVWSSVLPRWSLPWWRH